MNKYMLALLTVASVSHLTPSFAQDEVIYGYDKLSHEIYAQRGNEKGVLKFEEDYSGNPSYSFDFFLVLRRF